VVEKNDSVNVLYVDDKGRLYITQEYRTALRAYGYKLPGGKAEKGETVLAAAKREFEEETGLKPIAPKLLYRARGGATTRWNRYFFMTRQAKPGKLNMDPGEAVKLLKVPIKKAVAMAWRGDFYSGETAYAVLLFAKKLRKL
jgi:8-oxo-dGTP pyrophosphatase MutT (NUDIX family)